MPSQMKSAYFTFSQCNELDEDSDHECADGYRSETLLDAPQPHTLVGFCPRVEFRFSIESSRRRDSFPVPVREQNARRTKNGRDDWI